MGLYLLWTGIWPGMLLAMLIPVVILWHMSRQGIWKFEMLSGALAAATAQGLTLLIVIMMLAGFFSQIMNNPPSSDIPAGRGGIVINEIGP